MVPSKLVNQSSRHTVMSSHGQLVTGHLVTQASRQSSHSQLVTGEHITKPPVPVCTPSGDIQKQCSTRRNHRYLCYFNVYCRLQITATDYTSTKSTVNSLQRSEMRRSTRHMILRCDELTGSRKLHCSQNGPRVLLWLWLVGLYPVYTIQPVVKPVIKLGCMTVLTTVDTRNGIMGLSLLIIFNRGRHLYSEGGHHLGIRPHSSSRYSVHC